MCILLFDLKEQLPMTLQNVSEVNRELSRLAAASSVCDSTKHNGLVTICTEHFTAGIRGGWLEWPCYVTDRRTKKI